MLDGITSVSFSLHSKWLHFIALWQLLIIVHFQKIIDTNILVILVLTGKNDKKLERFTIFLLHKIWTVTTCSWLHPSVRVVSHILLQIPTKFACSLYWNYAKWTLIKASGREHHSLLWQTVLTRPVHWNSDNDLWLHSNTTVDDFCKLLLNQFHSQSLGQSVDHGKIQKVNVLITDLHAHIY